MGLADWFSTFCSNIQVKDGGTISTRYKAITQRLNTDFWATTSDTAHSLYVGSYGRNTAIDGFSDLRYSLSAALLGLRAIQPPCRKWPVVAFAVGQDIHREDLLQDEHQGGRASDSCAVH